MKEKKYFSLIVIFVLVLIIALTVTLLSIKLTTKISSDSENTITENNNIGNKHNELNYINKEYSKASNSKLAFVFGYHNIGETVITIDYPEIIKDDLSIEETSIKNSVISVTKYDYSAMELDFKINNTNYIIELESGTDSNKEIQKKGRWILKEGNINNSYTLYYMFDNSNTKHNLAFSIFNSSLEDAKEYMNSAMDIFNVYYGITYDNYINVKDVEGNITSLNNYKFFNDIVSENLKEDGLSIKESLYITDLDNQKLTISIPYEKGVLNYELKRKKYNYSDSYEVQDTFTLNKASVQIIESYNERAKNFYITSNSKYYAINCSLPYNEDKVDLDNHKQLFISNFN